MSEQGDMGEQGETSEQESWRWHYSRWIGVMYGPIPIGIIVVAIAAAIYFGTQ